MGGEAAVGGADGGGWRRDCPGAERANALVAWVGELTQRGDFRNFRPFARLRFAAVFRQKRLWPGA